ncbi:hypothetical protein AB0E01_23170 [Nocardia vinacea]|uniref:phage tail fiber protein n=1 Tax=Nocardia vinacea TaxID=96468 RepID=UPI0033E1FF43
MSIAVATSRQALADTYKGLGTGGSGSTAWMSLHTGDPGTTGANEASGGSPAYGRVQVTWVSGTGGVLTATAVTFNGYNATFTHCGLWSAQTGGTFLDKAALNPSINLGGNGPITVNPSFTVS